jgi:adenylate cyclase class 2
MNFEVEQKHRVDDSAALLRRLAQHGATLGPPIKQADEYFNHPCRDFTQTDEALRIRTVGDASVVTYKGPKLDATTKTRRELELPLAVSHAEFAELLAALGFQPVLTVRKSRRPFELDHRGQTVHCAWDEVGGVGTFIELELVADEAGLEEARRIIASLAVDLELGPSERRSYLELLLGTSAFPG